MSPIGSAHGNRASRAALVTGCSTGIGRAVALALHEAGLPVYATARRPDALRMLADRGLATMRLDVTDEDSRVAAVRRVEAEHGAVGVLVNNAGYALQGPVEETPLEQARAQFETNLFGLVRLIQLALPAMREQRWGRVVNMSSMGGRFAFPGGGFYHASKHAVEGLSDALRYELRPFGVVVVVVEPGPVQTSFGDTAIATIEPAPGPYAQFRQDLSERYQRAYDGSAARLNCSADDVARIVRKAVLSRRPRSRYTVGPVAKGLIGLRRFAPAPVFDAVMVRSFPTPAPGPPAGRE